MSDAAASGPGDAGIPRKPLKTVLMGLYVTIVGVGLVSLGTGQVTLPGLAVMFVGSVFVGVGLLRI